MIFKLFAYSATSIRSCLRSLAAAPLPTTAAVVKARLPQMSEHHCRSRQRGIHRVAGGGG